MRRLMWLGLLFAGLFISGHAYACNTPNPNLGAPPFVDGCPVPAAALNRLANAANIPGVDARLFGATCGTSDSSAGIQAAINTVAQFTGGTGGTVMVTCPMTASTGNISLYSGTTLSGNGPGLGYAGMQDIPGPAVWPPTTFGGAINCTSQSNPCFNVEGPGVQISNLLIGNTEPTPPSSGNYSPIVYPYVISTSCGANYAGLNIHDDMFVSVYDGIDLEGCSNYNTANSGGYITIDNIVSNVALNNFIKIHLIDYTPVRISRVEGWGMWNYNVASLGNYVRSNLKFMDVEYCAACMFSQIETPPGEYGIYFDNGTVNNGANVTLSFVGTMDQMNFQNSCQALYSSNTSLSMWLNLSDSIIWGDQTGDKCSQGKAMIYLPSNLVYLGINNLDATSIDTLLDVGCGTPGTGSCPSSANGGSAYVRLADAFVNTYDINTSTAPLIEIPSTTVLSMQDTDPLQLIPNNGATGKLFGAGFDGSQGCQRPLQMGGGINPSFGSVLISDSCGLSSGNSGTIGLYDNTNSLLAAITANGSGVNLQGASGPVFIKGNNLNVGVSVGATGTTLNLLESGLPTIGSLTKLGTVCVATTGQIYYSGTTC